ncbi:hypothetical protein [Rufibacter roseus]|uniref:Lipoprotein n=1 Tax=Rufibacter roseus TaxID=1567108 RepID=A0ABW2DJX3_9BACT|nr:hypothetical protein [Rufibacter roseus]
MKNILLLLLFLLTLVGCQPTQQEPLEVRKECVYQTDNPTLRIYNDALIELVETSFYNYYLGDHLKDVPFDTTFNENTADSASLKKEIARINSELAKAQHKTFNNPAQWCTVYLDTAWRGSHVFKSMATKRPNDNLNHRLQQSLEFNISEWNLSHLDSFKTMQTDFTAKDFQSCTFKVAPIDSLGQNSSTCETIRVQFSKAAFNYNKTKAWLYYEFMCGSRCGVGEVLHLEKSGEKWEIRKSVMLWIS